MYPATAAREVTIIFIWIDDNTMNSNSEHTYKVPQDIIAEILRIAFKSSVRHKIKSVMPNDNIITVEFDFSTVRSEEPRENIENVLEDYREFMKDILGDAIENLYDESEEDD